jgi:hypothetical protein
LFATIKTKQEQHAIVNLHIASLNIISITIILAASIVSVALTEFGSIGIAQCQANLTPQQKAAIHDPNNPKLKFVNSTESRICQSTNMISEKQENNSFLLRKQ